MAVEPQAPRLLAQPRLVGARPGDEEAHAGEPLDDLRQRVEGNLKALLVDQSPNEQDELLGRLGVAAPQGRQVIDRREVEGIDPVRDDTDLGLVDLEHVGHVALHVVAADDHGLGAARHLTLDPVDVALRMPLDPALVAAELGGVDGGEVREPRLPRQGAGGAGHEPVVTVHDVEVVARGERAAGREHVVVHRLDEGHELVEVARRARAGNAVHAHAGAPSGVALAPAREDVDGHPEADERLGELAHVAGEAALDERGVLPREDEDAPAALAGPDPTDAATARLQAKWRFCPALRAEAGQDRAA